MELKFHRTNRTTIITWTIGAALLALYKVTGMDFFHVHYYLLFMGFVSILLSRNKYAFANDFGITIFYGPLLIKRPLLLKWEIVDSMQLSSSNFSWIQTLGARVQALAKMNVSASAIKVTLIEPLSAELQGNMKRYLSKCLFPPVEAINESGDEIFLKEQPSGGFNDFIKKLSLFKDLSGQAKNLS